MNQEAEPIDRELVDKMGELIAILGLDKARGLAISIFVENGWNVDEAADIVGRYIKAWHGPQCNGGETNERGGILGANGLQE